jgi:hypothetical protein
MDRQARLPGAYQDHLVDRLLRQFLGEVDRVVAFSSSALLANDTLDRPLGDLLGLAFLPGVTRREVDLVQGMLAPPFPLPVG